MDTKNNETIGLVNSLEAGGAERQMAFLSQYGIVSKVVTLTSQRWFAFDGDVVSLFTSDKKLSRTKRIFMIPNAAWKLRKYVQKNQKVISFAERSNIVSIINKVWMSHKALVNVLTNPNRSYTGIKYLQRIAMRLLYPFATLIITNSVGVKKMLINSYGFRKDKVVVVPNGIDIPLVKTMAIDSIAQEHEYLFSSGQVCIIVGRFELPKGQWHAIRSFKNVVVAFPDAKLVLIGEGTMHDSLVQLIKRLNLEKSVVFIGHQKNPFAYISRADLLLLPSLWEGLPNVVIEAIACDTPVVATDCDFGPREILKPSSLEDIHDRIEYTEHGALTPTWKNSSVDTTTLIPSEEERAFAEAVIEMLKKGKHIFNDQNLLDRFSKEAVVALWKETIDRC